MSDNEPILVGVNGSRGSSAAIRYAVHEARRLGTDVRLVHVLHEIVPVSPMFPLLPSDLQNAGQSLLEGAAAEARELDPSVPVSTTLAHGPRALALLEAAKSAQLVVLGHEPRATFERLVTGSTVTPLAAMALRPVVVVHPDWSPTQEQACVLVGIKSTPHSEQLLRGGFEAAARRGARLLLVHSWELPNEYDELISSRVDQAGCVRPAANAIQAGIEGLTKAYPEVPVEIRVVHGQAAWVLREASNEADLVLLARRARLFPTGHLGGTLRALLRHSHCPVAVLPSAHQRDQGQDLVLEQDGVLQE
ncbi:MAG: universal stress protein [Marmoricola sp.]